MAQSGNEGSEDSRSRKMESLIKNMTELLPESLREVLDKRIGESISYEPRVGVMGKSGAGKSSLCNAIFRERVCAVSDVEACTREVKELTIRFNNHTLKLIDIPGVGENELRDREYEVLYRELIPDLDVILWIMKGDDRAFSSDEHFYKNVVKPAGGETKILFVLNQADKIEPFREWNVNCHQPSPSQRINIERKENYLKERFGFTEHPVISVSANEYWNINSLVEAMIRALPKYAKSGFAAQLKDDLKTETVKNDASDGFSDTVAEMIDDVIDLLPVPEVVKKVAKAAKQVVVNTAKKLWGAIFG